MTDTNPELEARLAAVEGRVDAVEAKLEELAPEPTPAPEPVPQPEPTPEPDTPNTEPDEPWPGYAVDVESWNAMVRAHANESGKSLEQAAADCDVFFTDIREGRLVLDESTGEYVRA